MIEFVIDCSANGLEFLDSTVTSKGFRKKLLPGSYTIQITDGNYSPFSDNRDAEPSIMLWLLHEWDGDRKGRHRDRSTNVITHSQFRSLAGVGDSVTIDVYERTYLWAFWFDEYADDNSGAVKLAIDSDFGRETIEVDASKHSVTFPEWGSKKEAIETIDLPTGTHVIRIERGDFSFFPDGRDAEPTVILWVSEGRQKDIKTGVETPVTVRTLNGYGDTLTVEVTSPAKLRAFHIGSVPKDFTGSVVIRVLSDRSTSAKHRVLLIDGQSEHLTAWRGISARLKAYLEQTGLFDVDIFRANRYLPPHGFTPPFENYDAVVLNYSSQVERDDFTTRHHLRHWPPAVEAAFEEYVNNGGGVVIVHSANNSFPEWSEYNKMIGLGGWYGRNPESGPFIYYVEENGEWILKRDPALDKQFGGGHPNGVQPYLVESRDSTHPIMSGLPDVWMHASDELYQYLRGPAQNMEILATAYSDPDAWPSPNSETQIPSGRHEPLLMTIRYGKGRIFHTALGHCHDEEGHTGYESIHCVGFITTLQRGVEWVVTGDVTQPVPPDFPSDEAISTRQFQE